MGRLITPSDIDGFELFAQRAQKVKRVAIIGDSFVGGSGSTDPKTFGVPLASALRAKYGDAGAGYIPVADAKMAGLGHTANFFGFNSHPNSSSFTKWNDNAYHPKAFNGLGYYRAGGAGGTDGNESVYYVPNVADSFKRGVADTMAYVAVYFTLVTAKAGFLIRQNDQSLSAASFVSSGAAFTGSVSGTTLTASSVTGIIPRAGAAISGGVSAGTIITSNGTGNGSAGTYGVNNSQMVGSTSMTVEGNTCAATGEPQMILHRLDPAKSNSVQITGVYGDVIIHGVEYFNGASGVVISDFGQGGTTAYQWASLDDAAQRSLWRLSNFDQVIVSLGMNDRTYMEPAFFGDSIATIVSRIQACSRTKVLLARQTDASYAGSTYQQYYDEVLQNVALAMGCGYVDERACAGFADYATANAAGLMLDGVHRNAAGNTLMGAFYADRMSL